MLIELHVKDFAVIDSLSVEFTGGLTALTGETGAGKSILVDAVALLLGERASTDVVRAGAERARVEGVFEIGRIPKLVDALERLGYGSEDGLLLLRREVAAQGRSRAWVNGSPATVATMSELAAELADLHSQHEYQNLLRPGQQRAILDAFAGARELSGEVADLWNQHSALHAQLDERRARNRELEGKADFLRFQSTEIRGANPESAEDSELETEATRLGHAGELASEAASLYEALYGSEEAAADAVARARERLDRLSGFDPGLAAVATRLEEAYHLLADAGRELGDYASSIEHDPARLDAVHSRLDLLARLKRKYGPTLEDVLATCDRIESELSELDGAALECADLEKQIEVAGAAYQERATELTRRRGKAARELSRLVQEMLPALGLKGSVFQVLVERMSEPGPGGAESIRFRASLNPGFEPKSLSKIASGGELSRVMLALKSALVDVDPVPTLVFDEVDAGVGGAVAVSVAERLTRIAAQRQVFVITHLAQVASRADQHFRVEKSMESGRAASRVVRLSSEQRVGEIARMLGGDPESQASRAHALELLGSG